MMTRGKCTLSAILALMVKLLHFFLLKSATFH